MKLREIAERLHCRLTGDGEIEIEGVAGLEEAGPQQLTFLSNPSYARQVKKTRAAAILLENEIPGLALPCLLSENAYLDFARVLEWFYQPPRPPAGVHPTAAIAPTAKIGANASIGAHAVVGEGVVIGSDAVLHPHVVIYPGVRIGDRFEAHSHAVVREHCEIGDRVILQNGVVVGSDGFGFARQSDGFHYKIVQSGRVVIEDDVEIQAHSCIDRAAVGETRIGRGTKIDNLVQVGHAVQVGEKNILCSQVGIAGSTRLGDNCILAGQVGLINHLTLGDNVIVTAQTGVGHDVPSGQKISGSPAFDNRQWLRATAVFARLPELAKAVRELQRDAHQQESADIKKDK
jgi:UDP-3-O-[3-hydroxymyristoyl] glucosamine N-acyltransferase